MEIVGPDNLLKMNLFSKSFYSDFVPLYMIGRKDYFCKFNRLNYLYVSSERSILYAIPSINSQDSEDYFKLKNHLFSFE